PIANVPAGTNTSRLGVCSTRTTRPACSPATATPPRATSDNASARMRADPDAESTREQPRERHAYALAAAGGGGCEPFEQRARGRLAAAALREQDQRLGADVGVLVLDGGVEGFLVGSLKCGAANLRRGILHRELGKRGATGNERVRLAL